VSHDHPHHADHADHGDCACGHAHGPRRIYIYSPSSAVRDKAAFRRGVQRLQALGHEVEIDRDALAVHMRFAGDDATRLAAIARAAASGADVALVSRGGYGLTRILPGIDYAAVAKAVEGGMRFVGVSDFTAFQNAVLARTGATTWAGPALCQDFGVAGAPDDIMEACFDDLLTGHGEGAGWRLPYPRSRVARASTPDYAFELHDAPLWGGNLAVLASLVGTPWLPQVDGGVLFLEDVNEHPYRIERLLTQLLHAGVLGRQKAVLLGQFTGIRLAPHDKGFGMDSVVQWLRSQIAAPVLTGLPYGHVATKVLLPVGAKVDVAVDGRDAMLVWGHPH
jgi:muramoyltetrapeptide carboxypeptidase